MQMTIALTLGFFIAWTPYAVVAFAYVLCDYDSVPVALSVAAVLLAKSSTTLNPIVYFFSVKKFRCVSAHPVGDCDQF